MVAAGLPDVVELEQLPARVLICEVGPRDGLQNESAIVPLEVKLEFIERLVDAGHQLVEVTSFVHPSWVPQLADAEQLLSRLERRPGVRYPVLVPNARGLDRALDAGVERDRDLRQRHRDLRPAQPQPDDGRVDGRCSRRWWPVPASAACGCGATCRCASATRGRAGCRCPRWCGRPPT